MNPGRQSSQRATLHVDVGPELSARVRAAAAAGGCTPSEWTRELLQRELAREAVPAEGEQPQEQSNLKLSDPSPATPAAAGRLVLDSELASLLQQVQVQGQFRTRPAALRLVLRHFIGQGPTPAAEPIDATPLKDGVAALMRSNHELLPIGKNINQIAKSLNAMQGSFRNAETQNLQAFAQVVRDHVEQAARVVSAIRVLVTPHKEKP